MVDTLVPSNPYVGPRSIKTGKAFFGREREIRSLSALLSTRLLHQFHAHNLPFVEKTNS
jgi:hypothetical protein